VNKIEALKAEKLSRVLGGFSDEEGEAISRRFLAQLGWVFGSKRHGNVEAPCETREPPAGSPIDQEPPDAEGRHPQGSSSLSRRKGRLPLSVEAIQQLSVVQRDATVAVRFGIF